tara:strand:+ start:46156 stop:47802 length:1647 start_codon:yes stop_codon:yes gene_type:complete
VTNKPNEVIVIGSGATGGMAALTLAKAGIKVLVIEAGPQLSAKEAFGSEPFNSYRRLFGLIKGSYKKQAQHPGFWKSNPLLYSNEKESIYSHPKDKPFIWTQGNQVGGKSLTWGGITLRLSDYDFKAARKDGFAPEWPIEYSDLSDHYTFIEKLIEIYGSKDNLDYLPDGNYIGEFPFTEIEEYFAEKVKINLGLKVIHSRGFGPNINSYNNKWPKFSSPGSTLGLAIKTGKVEILTEHIAERLIMNSSREKAKGIVIVNKKNGKRRFLKSNLIVLCASTIQSIRFLLDSEDNNQENGFIDPSGNLGCYLMDHISTCRFFSIPNTPSTSPNNSKQVLSGAGSFFIPFGNKSSNYKEHNFIRGYGIWGGIDRFEPPDFLKFKPKTKTGFLIGHGEVLPKKENKVTLSKKTDIWGIKTPHIDCQWGENEKKMVEHINKTIKEIVNSSGGEILPLNKIIKLPFLDNIINKTLATQKAAPPPGYYIHEVGGARMGSSENESVLNKWNQLWNCKNVLVVDGSCWPTSSWQSPTLTLMAITRRACLNVIKPSAE